MPAQPTPIKKPLAKREVRKPILTTLPKGKLPKGPIAAKAKVRKPMEPLEEKEQIVEEEQVEQVVSETEVQTAQSEQPQSHEVELMMIPVKNYTTQMPNEEHQANPAEEVAAQPRRRMSSESSDHKRRFTRGDSEVKIEDILTRVFEDITAVPKAKPTANSQPKKSPAPPARKPPVAKPAAKPVATKPTKPPAPKPQPKSQAPVAKKPATPKVVAKKEPVKVEKPAPPKPPTPEPVEVKPTPPPPTVKKPPTARASSAGKQPLLVKKVALTPPKAALPKKTAPVKKLP